MDHLEVISATFEKNWRERGLEDPKMLQNLNPSSQLHLKEEILSAIIEIQDQIIYAAKRPSFNEQTMLNLWRNHVFQLMFQHNKKLEESKITDSKLNKEVFMNN
jgi:hypothetical protein